jgi:GntR family transcriptional regulator
MNTEWHDNSPIFRQLKERIVEMIIDGSLQPGDAVPSVRQVAAQFQLNPITVSRAYTELADQALLEKRRGLGLYVVAGAREALLATLRQQFIENEWPVIAKKMALLGIKTADLKSNQEKL